eukprot:TRINITY_DN6518_c0_g1_i1.p1 TRINITY_DN6518_c0_g1~~TRINITY_DN6518_c0_g1_i1.p1  ORF type:complete len:2052 (+),score=727.37 TRINITY_DN6518_c0_g1_i1:170-6325(+)
MDEIIEVFSEAISGFILLSITLQERNANPPPDLRKHGDAVVQTSKAVVAVSRDLSKQFYTLPDVQQRMLTCSDGLEGATTVVDRTISDLFTDPDRARGWKNLVDATKDIGQESCRLLVIVYGADQKRLEKAANDALAALAVLRTHTEKSPQALQQTVNEMVSSATDAASKVGQFNSFFYRRVLDEKDGYKQDYLNNVHNQLSRVNETMIGETNSVAYDANSMPARDSMKRSIKGLEDLITEVMGILKTAEEFDAFKIIENLFNITNRAMLTPAKPLASLANTGLPPVTPSELRDAGEKAKAAIRIVQQHSQHTDKDIINNTNIASSRLAHFTELVGRMSHENVVAPALKPKLASFYRVLSDENTEIVAKTNGYLEKGEGVDQLRRELSDLGKTDQVGENKATVRSKARDMVKSASDIVRSGGTGPEFLPAAKSVTGNARDLISAVTALADSANPQLKQELLVEAGAAKTAVVQLVQAGQALARNPNDANAKGLLTRATGDLKGHITTLMKKSEAVPSKSGASTAPPAGAARQAATQDLNDSCAKTIKTIDEIIGEVCPVVPAFAPIMGSHSVQCNNVGPTSVGDLLQTAELVLKAINRHRDFPKSTPKETIASLENAAGLIHKFSGQCKKRGETTTPDSLKQLLDHAADATHRGNQGLIRSTKDHVDFPSNASKTGINNSCDDVEREVLKVIAALKPNAVQMSAMRAPQGHVTARDIVNLADKVRDDVGKTGQFRSVLPAETSRNANVTSDDMAALGGMVKDFADKHKNPMLQNMLRDAVRDMEQGRGDIVNGVNQYFENPDDRQNNDRLSSACHKVPPVLDDIIAELMPTVNCTNSNERAHGRVSPKDLQDAADALKESLDRVDEHQHLSPKETAAASAEASRRAADFAGKCAARANQVNHPVMRSTLGDGGRKMDAGNREMVGATNALFEDPDSPTLSNNLLNNTGDMRRIADEVMASILPEARTADELNGRLSHKISPKEVEEGGERVKRALAPVSQFRDAMPKELVADVTAASGEIEKFRQILNTMEEQVDRPAVRRKLAEASHALRNANLELADATNTFLNDPDAQTAGRRLEEVQADIIRRVNAIVKDVKPQAQVAKSSGVTGQTAPQELARVAEEVKRQARAIKAGYQNAASDDLAKQTGDCSEVTAKLTDMVNARSKKDQRPTVAQTLTQVGRELGTANQKLVGSSNEYIAEPNQVANQKNVEGSCDQLVQLADRVLDTLLPKTTLATVTVPSAKPTIADIEITAAEVRKAVTKVKTYNNMSPKESAAASDDASKKVAKLSGQLQARSKHAANPSYRDLQRQWADDLQRGNKQLVDSTTSYLLNPDDAATCQDVDASADNLLFTLDDILGKIRPKANLTTEVTATHPVRAVNLEKAAEEAIRAIEKLEGFEDHVPTEIATNATDASGKTGVFTGMVARRSQDSKHPALKKSLQDAVGRLKKGNTAMVDSTNRHIDDPDEASRKRQLKADCETVKNAIREVLGDVKPTATITKPDQNKIRTLRPDPNSLERAADELKKACTVVQDFTKHTPKETARNTEEASRKAAAFAEQVKARAGKVRNTELSSFLNNAYDRVNDGNQQLIDACNAYMDDPDDSKLQQNLDAAAENLKRIADEVMGQVKPTAKHTDAASVRVHDSNPSTGALKDAYQEAKISVAETTPFRELAPKKIAELTSKASEKSAKFGALAKAKLAHVTDPSRKAKLTAALQSLEKENARFVTVANAHITDPDTDRTATAFDGARRDLDAALDAAFGLVKPTASLTQPGAARRVPVSTEQFEEFGDLVKRAVRPLQRPANLTEDEIAKKATDTSKHLAKFIELVQSKRLDPDLDSDELRHALTKANENLPRSNENVVRSANALIDDSESNRAAEALAGSSESVASIVDQVLDAVREADKPISFEEQIEEAAEDILQFIMQFGNDEMGLLAQRIAEEMNALAEAARTQNRTEVIQRARNIAVLTKQLEKVCLTHQAKCTNRHMREDISVGTKCMTNFSTQLKIIAAVKAASIGYGSDPTAENQVVACCRGICTGIKQGIQSAHAAKLQM